MEGCGPRLESTHQELLLVISYKCHIPSVKQLLKQRPRHKRHTWAGEIKNWIVAQRSFQMKVKFAFHLEIKGPVWRKSGEASTLMITGLKVIHHKPVPHI